IGSCTNSSYRELMTVAAILQGKTIPPNVSLVISPGSRQVYETIARSGALADLIASGARILESACGPCIGMGQSPPSKGVTLRTFNRNFVGRSGTKDALVYLVSPEVAAATALRGVITDPRDLGDPVEIPEVDEFEIDDRMILPPAEDPDSVEVIRGPNIKPLPLKDPLENLVSGEVLLKVEDNITTDHIMPAGAKILPLRSNIPAISDHVFEGVDPTFASRAKSAGGGFIVGGENYGQGSSREHAALAPMYLGVKAVFARSFARIHRANLINFGIVPLTFVDPADYERIQQGDALEIAGLREALVQNADVQVKDRTQNRTFEVRHGLSERQCEIVMAGGLLNYTRERA
ncbi:aconitate hydratase, partial [candidate division TA06 bacterium SM1_40]